MTPRTDMREATVTDDHETWSGIRPEESKTSMEDAMENVGGDPRRSCAGLYDQ